MTPRTSVIMASPSARKKASRVARDSEAVFAIATASTSANRTYGTIAPLAAAAMGLAGSSEANHAEKDVATPLAATALAASAAPGGRAGRTPSGNWLRMNWDSGTITTAVATSSPRNTPSVRTPRRPMACTSDAEAMPVTTSASTSGITVMRMALIQRVPSGAMASANCSARSLPLAAMAPPVTMAASQREDDAGLRVHSCTSFSSTIKLWMGVLPVFTIRCVCGLL